MLSNAPLNCDKRNVFYLVTRFILKKTQLIYLLNYLNNVDNRLYKKVLSGSCTVSSMFKHYEHIIA